MRPKCFIKLKRMTAYARRAITVFIQNGELLSYISASSIASPMIGWTQIILYRIPLDWHRIALFCGSRFIASGWAFVYVMHSK